MPTINQLVRKGRKKPEYVNKVPALDLQRKETLLRQVMGYLKLPPAPAVDKPQELLGWAVQHWRLQAVPTRPIVAEIETA